MPAGDVNPDGTIDAEEVPLPAPGDPPVLDYPGSRHRKRIPPAPGRPLTRTGAPYGNAHLPGWTPPGQLPDWLQPPHRRYGAVLRAALPLLGVVALVAGIALVVAAIRGGSHPKALVRPDELPSIALPLGAAMHITPISASEFNVYETDKIDEPDVYPKSCAATWAPTQEMWHADDVSGIFVRHFTPNDLRGPQVTETLVAMTTSTAATAARDAVVSAWDGCALKTLVVGVGTRTSKILVGLVDDADPAVTVWGVVGSGGWGCQRAVTAKANVLIDVTACGQSPDRMARKLAEQMSGSPKLTG